MEKPNAASPENGVRSRLEQMIQQILDVDSQAQEITAQAQHRRERADSTIQEEKRRMRAEYMAEADRRLEMVEKQERELAEQELSRSRAQSARMREEFDRRAAAQKDAWADEIVRRCLEPAAPRE